MRAGRSYGKSESKPPGSKCETDTLTLQINGGTICSGVYVGFFPPTIFLTCFSNQNPKKEKQKNKSIILQTIFSIIAWCIKSPEPMVPRPRKI